MTDLLTDLPYEMVEHPQGDIIILKLEGKVDSITSPILVKKILDVIEKGYLRLLINLQEVTYMNSTGLRMLLTIQKQIKSVKGKAIFFNLAPDVFETIRLCGFDKILDICKDQEMSLNKI